MTSAVAALLIPILAVAISTAVSFWCRHRNIQTERRRDTYAKANTAVDTMDKTITAIVDNGSRTQDELTDDGLPDAVIELSLVLRKDTRARRPPEVLPQLIRTMRQIFDTTDGEDSNTIQIHRQAVTAAKAQHLFPQARIEINRRWGPR